MTIRVKTETGSTYEFNDDRTQFRRVEVGAQSQTLRGDGDWQTISVMYPIEVGKSMYIVMPVLDPPQFEGAQITERVTSRVTEIEGLI